MVRRFHPRPLRRSFGAAPRHARRADNNNRNANRRHTRATHCPGDNNRNANRHHNCAIHCACIIHHYTRTPGTRTRHGKAHTRHPRTRCPVTHTRHPTPHIRQAGRRVRPTNGTRHL